MSLRYLFALVATAALLATVLLDPAVRLTGASAQEQQSTDGEPKKKGKAGKKGAGKSANKGGKTATKKQVEPGGCPKWAKGAFKGAC